MIRVSVAKIFLYSSLVYTLAGCFGGGPDQDLNEYIDETLRRPGTVTLNFETIETPKSFVYSSEAQRLRDPFDRPVSELRDLIVNTGEAVRPDPNRVKEVLEEFNFAQLSMKGTYRDSNNTLWALINDGDGRIQAVKEGNYMGKNDGKIVSLTNTQVNVIEIVPDGADGWLQRPQSLKLEE